MNNNNQDMYLRIAWQAMNNSTNNNAKNFPISGVLFSSISHIDSSNNIHFCYPLIRSVFSLISTHFFPHILSQSPLPYILVSLLRVAIPQEM